MNAETIQAIKSGAEKYRAYALLADADDITKAGIRTDTCALCNLFLNPGGMAYKCMDCPVKILTGEKLCGGTPWDLVESAQRWVLAQVSNKVSPADSTQWRDACTKEADFLEALLEPLTPEPTTTT